MKVLVDEMHEGLVDKLRESGYEVESVKQLVNQGRPMRSDYSVLNYAKEHDMVLVSADIENQKGCQENDIMFVPINQNTILDVILTGLQRLQQKPD